MSNVTMQRVVVEAKSRFGVLDKVTEKWVNTQDKKVLDSIILGKEYELELGKDSKGRVVFTSAKLLSNNIPAEYKAQPKIVDAAPTNKDGRILAQGIVQHLIASPSTSAMTADELVTFVADNAPKMIALVKTLS